MGKKGYIGKKTVKKNMTGPAEAIAKSESTTRVVVSFHRYLGYHQDEVEMLRFTQSLGFELDSVWADLMPLEKALGYAGDEQYGTALTDEDRQLVARLALPLDRAMEVVRRTRRCRAGCATGRWR